MAKGRAVEIILDEAEERALTSLVRKHGAPQSLAVRARIALAAANGLTNKQIAAKLAICAHTAGVWRMGFARDRLDGLYDEPRPGAPRQIGDDEIAATVRKTLETRPKGATHWSLRTMAKALGHSPSTIHRIWQAFGLQPHRSETFKLSSDPLFVEKIRDIVGLYLSPPERAVVLCVDEKSQVQALDRTQPLLPMRPAKPSGAHTITPGAERPRSSPPSTSQPEPSSANACAAIALRSFAGSLTRSSATSLTISTSTSSWTITEPTRPS